MAAMIPRWLLGTSYPCKNTLLLHKDVLRELHACSRRSREKNMLLDQPRTGPSDLPWGQNRSRMGANECWSVDEARPRERAVSEYLDACEGSRERVIRPLWRLPGLSSVKELVGKTNHKKIIPLELAASRRDSLKIAKPFGRRDNGGAHCKLARVWCSGRQHTY
ncbi:hypothetical protein RRG08_058863 [Elysia crispata]|uniref:Uncharacterized protein n=1 Tax=Elysia crispata TaxID=231223 RepID=A0AAE0XZZ8_9GAST|nr:hypothetical protein RRG08_058863 [Elysia crispata]